MMPRQALPDQPREADGPRGRRFTNENGESKFPARVFGGSCQFERVDLVATAKEKWDENPPLAEEALIVRARPAAMPARPPQKSGHDDRGGPRTRCTSTASRSPGQGSGSSRSGSSRGGSRSTRRVGGSSQRRRKELEHYVARGGRRQGSPARNRTSGRRNGNRGKGGGRPGRRSGRPETSAERLLLICVAIHDSSRPPISALKSKGKGRRRRRAEQVKRCPLAQLIQFNYDGPSDEISATGINAFAIGLRDDGWGPR